MMGSLLLYALATALLGFQWRRQRTMGDEISVLKKTLPSLDGAASIAEAMATAIAAEDKNRVRTLQAALEIESQVNALLAERKELAAAAPKDKHFSQGAWLASMGTAFAIEVRNRYICTYTYPYKYILQWGRSDGMNPALLTPHLIPLQGPLNTFARAGKLFPGPHLYAGAGLVVLWAMAAACVPAMQKGDDTARTVHIGANVAGISLFAWQVVSGIPILLKVWEKTQWP